MDTLIRLLIVEDKMLIGAKISMLLIQLGYKVTGILPRGEDVLVHVEENQPDIILLDISLEGKMLSPHHCIKFLLFYTTIQAIHRKRF